MGSAKRFLAAGLLSALVAASVVLGGPARADPPHYVDHSGYGGLAPVSDMGVRLRSGNVSLSLVNDLQNGRFYRAKASYVLENPGPARTVTFGVPMEFQSDNFMELTQRGKELPEEIRRSVAKEVRITFEGRAVPCSPRLVEAVGSSRYAHTGNGTTLGTCVFELHLPSQRKLRLELELTGFVRILAGTAAQVGFWLSPAGHWAGPVERFRITADIGGYAPLAKVVSPPGAKVAATTVSWDLKGVVLGKDDAVKIQFPAGWDEFPEGYGWVRTSARVEVSAGGGQVANLADGDASTKWCAAVPASVEVRITGFEAPRGQRCAIRGLALATDCLDGPTWRDRGPAITALRVSACSNSGDGFDIALGAERWSYFRETGEHGRIGEAVFPARVLEGPPGCIRVDVREVDARAGGRFCIGELVPRVYCRDDTIKRPTLKEVQTREFDRARLLPNQE